MKRVFGSLTVAVLLAIGLGCSVDSPTTPVQQPQPPSGSSPNSDTWNITLNAVPQQITAGGGSRVEVTIVDSAGNWPANGALVQLVVNRGNFNVNGSLTPEALLTMTRGQSAAEFVARNLADNFLDGDFRVTATLDSSSSIILISASAFVEANFSFVAAGLTVGFENNSTASGGGIVSTTWDFGDGSKSSAFEPTHTYAEAGEYLVTLTVVGSDGATDTSSAVVSVSEPEV